MSTFEQQIRASDFSKFQDVLIEAQGELASEYFEIFNELRDYLKLHDDFIQNNDKAKDLFVFTLTYIFWGGEASDWIKDDKIVISPKQVGDKVSQLLSSLLVQLGWELKSLARGTETGLVSDLDPTLVKDTFIKIVKKEGLMYARDYQLLCQKKIDTMLTSRQAVPESDAESPIFGKYAFAEDRLDTPREPNTEYERRVQRALERHYNDTQKLSAEIADTILDLVNDGQYLKLLRFPSEKYPTVYRGMSVDEETLTDYIDLNDLKNATSTQEWKERPVKGVARPRAATASWSISRAVAEQFASGRCDDETPYAIILQADVSDNPDTFIMNPDTIYNVNDFISYDGEEEAIAVGPVKFNKIHIKVHEYYDK